VFFFILREFFIRQHFSVSALDFDYLFKGSIFQVLCLIQLQTFLSDKLTVEPVSAALHTDLRKTLQLLIKRK